MVIQTNEQEFKGKTLQEYLNWEYPTKEDKEGVEWINIHSINKARREAGIKGNLYYKGGELDLREFVNLVKLRIGTMEYSLEKCHNKFYGFLKSYQNLTKLKAICIEATDVNEGLEYLPESLAKATNGGKYNNIECSPHNTNAKCKVIQDQLRPFNYDIEAWQLANPAKMAPIWKERYQNKEQLIKDLETKIQQTEEELKITKTNEADKTKKIERLEIKLKPLQETHDKIKTELEKEQQQHNQTKTNFQSQLRDLATILFPSNHPLDNLSFSALKEQTEKVIKKNQDQSTQIQELARTKSTIHQQTQTEFNNSEKETQSRVKEASIPFEINNSTSQSKEEIKWETIKIGSEKETDLTRLANGVYWDIQIQTLQDNLLPVNKQSIVLKKRLWQREQQTETKIENPPR